jgi:hypothetical protein
VLRYHAICSMDFLRDSNDADIKSLANVCVKCSCLDSRDDVVAVDVEEY